MLAARRSLKGEAEFVAKTHLTDPELRRARDLAMARMKAQGFTVKQIAKYHRLGRCYVHQRLAAMPESAKRRAVAG